MSQDNRTAAERADDAAELYRMMVKFLTMPDGPRRDAARKAVERTTREEEARRE